MDVLGHSYPVILDIVTLVNKTLSENIAWALIFNNLYSQTLMMSLALCRCSLRGIPFICPWGSLADRPEDRSWRWLPCSGGKGT